MFYAHTINQCLEPRVSRVDCDCEMRANCANKLWNDCMCINMACEKCILLDFQRLEALFLGHHEQDVCDRGASGLRSSAAWAHGCLVAETVALCCVRWEERDTEELLHCPPEKEGAKSKMCGAGHRMTQALALDNPSVQVCASHGLDRNFWVCKASLSPGWHCTRPRGWCTRCLWRCKNRRRLQNGGWGRGCPDLLS